LIGLLLRQGDYKGRSFSMFAAIANRSTMGTDDLLDDRKPNTSTLRFGGKERLKNIYACGNACAGVRNFQDDAILGS
jgi:hypothetical protein